MTDNSASIDQNKQCDERETYRNIYEKQGGAAPHLALRPATGVSFALFDGEATLFSEAAQGLYALNPVAALIWCCLAEGADAEAAHARLVEAGIDEAAARQHLDDAIGSWLRLGVLRADFGPGQERRASAFRVGDLAFRVETSSETLSQEIAALFGAHGSDFGGDSAVCIKAVEFNGSFCVYFDDRKVADCTADELAPAIKAEVTERLLAEDREDIAFHAACMSRNGRTLLVSGAPGAGKTTLALHLAAKGFGFGGDDITLISRDGLAKGVAFAPAVKEGAWDFVGRVRPDLPGAPIHRRFDGKRVRYIEPRGVDSDPKPVGWIVFIRRESGGGVKFTRIGALEALGRLIEGSYSPVGRLSGAGFAALRRLLAGAETYELAYRSADEASDAIRALCDDRT